MEKENNVYNAYFPDYAIPPGETLLEVIESMGITQAELAERLDRPKKTVNEIIKGKAAITPETAIQLERVVHVPASFWNKLENNYRADLARIAEKQRLERDASWLTQFPLKQMITKQWIQKGSNNIEQMEYLLSYFGVASVSAWQKKWGQMDETAIHFRKSVSEDDYPALTAWVRYGEKLAEQTELEPFDKETFRKAIWEIRENAGCNILALQEKMQHLCAKSGVLLVFAPELPNVKVHGFTRWLNARKAVIQISLHNRSNDQLLFSFFHEAAHILLHARKDLADSKSLAVMEKEANEFALDMLVQESVYREFVVSLKKPITEQDVVSFAKGEHIPPSVVVGRLQHDKLLKKTEMNHLKEYFV